METWLLFWSCFRIQKEKMCGIAHQVKHMSLNYAGAIQNTPPSPHQPPHTYPDVSDGTIRPNTTCQVQGLCLYNTPGCHLTPNSLWYHHSLCPQLFPFDFPFLFCIYFFHALLLLPIHFYHLLFTFHFHSCFTFPYFFLTV